MSEQPESEQTEDPVAFMRRQHELMHMSATDNMHRMHDLLAKIDKDDLDSMIFLFELLERSPEITPYFHGIAVGERYKRFKICPVCKKDHDEETAKLLENTAEEAVNTELAEWDLEVNPEDPTGLRCTKCGKHYPNLEDRKLRPKGVDGCNGCQERGGWG